MTISKQMLHVVTVDAVYSLVVAQMHLVIIIMNDYNSSCHEFNLLP